MATRFAGTELTNFMSTPNFGEMSRVGMDAQTMERNAATKAEGLVHGTGINSMAAVASAGYQADAIKAQGAAQAQSSIASGIGSMASGIAGGFGARGTGGGTGAVTMQATDAVPRNAYSTYTPSYNFFA